MEKLEKVIKGMELCGYQEGMPQCDSCPYDGKDCWRRLKQDALSLLKAQEPIKPNVKIDTWVCGACGTRLERQSLIGPNAVLAETFNYCHECGRAVKWDG